MICQKNWSPSFQGGKYDGQKQKWFAMKFLGINSDININTKHPEFSNWKWMTKELPIGAHSSI